MKVLPESYRRLLTPEQRREIGERKSVQRRGKMNKTEAEFAMYLEAMKRNGEIIRYEFEGITLRWAGIKYTPDFVVFTNVMQMLKQMEVIKAGDFSTVEWHGIKFIEVKGGFTGGKFERAIERFRHARTYWTEFGFELHKKTKQGWKQIE